MGSSAARRSLGRRATISSRGGPHSNQGRGALLDLRQDILLNPDRHALTRAQVGGPTDLYNLFDDPRCDNPSIQRLREAHHAVEFAILTEYGWQDLHGPWTFDRPWIDGTWRHVPPAATRRAYLERLAALNHEQAAAAAKDKSR